MMVLACCQAASADEAGQTPCDLVYTADLAETGFGIVRLPATDVLDLYQGEADAPVDTHTEICTFLAGHSGDRMGLQLPIETFGERVTPAQISAWTALIMNDDPAYYFATRVGDAYCEAGKFDLIDERTEAREGTQHFVSCEALEPFGNHRVNLYLLAPEFKALLDKATGRVSTRGALRV
jgi:hypothetical protein